MWLPIFGTLIDYLILTMTGSLHITLGFVFPETILHFTGIGILIAIFTTTFLTACRQNDPSLYLTPDNRLRFMLLCFVKRDLGAGIAAGAVYSIHYLLWSGVLVVLVGSGNATEAVRFGMHAFGAFVLEMECLAIVLLTVSVLIRMKGPEQKPELRIY